MRWPWKRPKVAPLVKEDPLPSEDLAESTDALRRAHQALRQAETNGQAMHEVTRRIRRERQANHFSESMFRAMRKKES